MSASGDFYQYQPLQAKERERHFQSIFETASDGLKIKIGKL